MKTQSEKVLEYMQVNGGITSMDAFRDLGITRLSARIWDLRKEGTEIDNYRVSYKAPDGTHKHYDVYTLA